jgi:hypothetical protein
MGKTRKDRRDRDFTFERSKDGKKVSEKDKKKISNQYSGLSASDLLEDEEDLLDSDFEDEEDLLDSDFVE